MTDKADRGWRAPRSIVERINVMGNLVLQTPAHFGRGDPGPLDNVDMVLLRDPLESKALLPGASIAGALRNHLRETSAGYGGQEGTAVTLLFGGSKASDQGSQSPLIVDDALAEISDVELRDGVRIDEVTRTAVKGAKFDMELLPAGTVFPLHLELLVEDGVQVDVLVNALARALHGFENGEIMLGARKRRGLGRCQVGEWTVARCRLTEPNGLLGWLEGEPVDRRSSTSIAEALGVALDEREDVRHRFTVNATFALDGSLMVRSGFGETDTGPDMVHLHALQPDGSRKPVLPGTSLAGVTRHRALRIANTIRPGKGRALVNRMFGSGEDTTLTASRVIVSESAVEKAVSLVQSRIKIDRFTGGAYETALFDEQPLFGDGRARLSVSLELRDPQDHEIGLLLLLLKDLWTGDLPVGGESSVGRGRLRGVEATLTMQRGSERTSWQIEEDGDRLRVDSPGGLQVYVDALNSQRWEVTT